ncbi:mandelate racemase/muconate lactonizing enzyme family protein [Thermus tengchongensis]|uniref:mandelate racemase/muconate lactonizing enzyme family protein n=1 Tax=Thermus tengchongensis TaxID=1214928 RepID=UPI001F3A3B25|nr:mandelate racemase/muconate lactonizing enzyme family protein [Thermus tengchongensis]
MAIKDVQTAVVEANYDWTFIKVIAEEGTGYGECFFAPGLTALIRELKPLLLGKDPRDIHRLLRILRTAGFQAGPQGGALQHALAGLETALWDLLGKVLRVPLYQLWGGAYRTRIRLYADCHAEAGLHSLSSTHLPRVPWWQSSSGTTKVHLEVDPKHHGGLKEEAKRVDPRAYGERAKQVVSQGYTALKFDLDIPTPYETDPFNRNLEPEEIELLANIVEAIRQSVGPQVALAFDCHWNFSAGSALKLAQALAPYRPLWLEDPVPPEADEALALVLRQSPVTIATGENHYHPHQFLRLLEKGLTVVTPDLQKVGLNQGRRIAELADLYTAMFAPHNIASPLGTLASAHLAATVPNFLLLEHHGLEVPFFTELVSGRESPLIQEGHLILEPQPGLGVSLNEEVAYRYRKKDEPFFA